MTDTKYSPHPRLKSGSQRARLDTFLYRHHALVHGGKTALAAGLGLLLGWLLKPLITHPEWQAEWIVITIVVVMTMLPNVGGVLLRSIYRLIATTLAALIALAVIFFTDYNPVAIMATLVIGVGVFTILAQYKKYRQLGVLCAITLAILLSMPEPKESIILWRTLDIILGVIVALLVSRFIFPIRAARQLRFHMADTITNLGRLFTLAAADEDIPEQDYEVLEDQISQGFIAQRDSLPLALLEHHRVRSRKACLEHMMRCQRSILGLSRTLRRAYRHTEFGEETIASLDGLDEVRTRIAGQLKAISAGIRKALAPQPDPELQISHSTLKVAMKASTQRANRPTMSPQAFTFAMEEIIKVTESLRMDAGRVALDLANATSPERDRQ